MEDLDVIEPNFWQGRRVFVTGHTGFKGAWLVLWLHSLGARIAGYALGPAPGPNLFEIARIGDLSEDLRGDIRDAVAVHGAIERFDPEIVFHLAAQSLVRRGYREPVETYATNVVGTAAVLEACRHAPSLRAVVCVTSDKCYENRDWVWGYREVDRLGGSDPYSSSKACAELVSDAYRRSYFAESSRHVGVATARAGNVIGGGDWGEDRLVPDIVRAVAAGRTARIRNPGAIRPWQHVIEPLAGYLALAARLADDPDAYSGGWNFGPAPGSFRSVEAVLAIMSARWKGKLQWTLDDADHPHEAARLVLDSNKAALGLHWQPKMGLEDALRLTVDWYDAWLSPRADLRQLSEAQIAYYTGLPATH